LDVSIKNSGISESTLIWAIICSILLHILFFVVVPNFKFDVINKIPDKLTVEIVQPKKPEPVVIPEPPKPIEPVAPQPEQIKPLSKKELKSEPKPVESKPEPIQAEPPPPPAIIAVTPKVDVAPEIKVPPPPPEPPKRIEADDAEYNAAKSTFRDNIQLEAARNLRYPKIAESRHISGKAKVEIKFDKEGNVTAATIINSSGNTSLDAEALAVIKRSDFRPYMKEALSSRIDSITIAIAVAFTLHGQ
jgi:periplasmic protein TonB